MSISRKEHAMSRRLIAIAGSTVACLAVLGGTAAAALEQVPVKSTALREELPAAGGSIFAWSQNTFSHPGVDNIWVEVGGSGAVRLNPRHTYAEAGGVDGDEVIFDQVNLDTFRSGIRIWNTTTHTFSIPPGVNTEGYEYWPTKSASWILYGRLGSHADRALLHNTTTGETVVLATDTSGEIVILPGQVSGNWAVWDVCRRVCNVFRYDIGAGTTTRIPNTVPGRYQYRPSVTADGTVYFVHSGQACGQGVRIMRQPLVGPPEVLLSVKPGRDIFSKTQAVPDPTSGTDLYYSRVRCTNVSNARDIFKVVVP
jgi:hypothetical protein